MVRSMTTAEFYASITDEMAQEEGYTDAAMYRKVLDLGALAGKWRRTKADEEVEAYHKLYAELIEEGWNPHTLTYEEALPDELMPELPEQWRRQAQAK